MTPKRFTNRSRRSSPRFATATTSTPSMAAYALKWPYGRLKLSGGISSSISPPMRPVPMIAAR